MTVSGSAEPSGSGAAWAGEGVNWDAYTHEELYRMVWEGADVADVSGIAEEWRRHSATLADHAVHLRDQQAALREDWEGDAAELAATQLGSLADRVDDISARAATNQQAAQEASEALALVRAMLPPPPGAAPAATAETAAPVREPRQAAPTTADFTSMDFGELGMDYASAFRSMDFTQFAPTAPSSTSGTGGFYFWFGAPPTSPTTSSFGSVANGGSSMYFTDFVANQSKAQAVYAMQVYESSLNRGGQLVAGPGATDARTYGLDRAPSGATTGGWQPAAGGQPGGVPWDRLVGRGQQPLAPGPGVSGRLPAGMSAPLGGMPAAEAAAARTAGHGGMVPPVGARGAGAEDERHENRMPVIDRGLFSVEGQISVPVIGVTPSGAGQ